MAWKCAICSLTCLLFSVLLSHYSSRHASDTSFTIRCNLNGCEKQYSYVKSFVRHVSGRHVVFLNCSGPSDTGGEPTFTAIHVEDDSGIFSVELFLQNGLNIWKFPD